MKLLGLEGMSKQGTLMPGDASVAAMMPKMTSVASSLTPEKMAQLNQLLGAEATQRAIMQRDADIANVNPYAQGSDLASMYGGDRGTMQRAYENSMALNQIQNRYLGEQDRSRAILNAAIEQNIGGASEYIEKMTQEMEDAKKAEEAKKGGGLMGFLGGALKTVAPFAIAAIPGVGPLAAMGLTMAANTAGNKMQGQSMGGSIANAGLETGLRAATGGFRAPASNTPSDAFMPQQGFGSGAAPQPMGNIGAVDFGGSSFIDPRTYGGRRIPGVNF
jgi:hypothetical protein